MFFFDAMFAVWFYWYTVGSYFEKDRRLLICLVLSSKFQALQWLQNVKAWDIRFYIICVIPVEILPTIGINLPAI